MTILYDEIYGINVTSHHKKKYTLSTSKIHIKETISLSLLIRKLYSSY